MTTSDRDTDSVEQDAFERLARKFARFTSDSWLLSPERTLLALLLSVEALALQFIARRPTVRDDVLAKLRQVVGNVAAASSSMRDEVKH